eukprot:scaffold1982_cov93-Amphora_coffeaeformis.AAC.36
MEQETGYTYLQTFYACGDYDENKRCFLLQGDLRVSQQGDGGANLVLELKRSLNEQGVMEHEDQNSNGVSTSSSGREAVSNLNMVGAAESEVLK